jgi:hypothetical protein
MCQEGREIPRWRWPALKGYAGDFSIRMEFVQEIDRYCLVATLVMPNPQQDAAPKPLLDCRVVKTLYDCLVFDGLQLDFTHGEAYVLQRWRVKFQGDER